MIGYLLLAYIGGRMDAPWWYFVLILLALWIKAQRFAICIARQGVTDDEQ